MAELFGAPLGMIAAGEQSRQNALAGLEAQKVMNTLALQPSQIELNKAHTGYYDAQAAEAQAKTDAANVMQRLGAGYTANVKARQAVIDGAAAKGETATVANLVASTKRPSPAQPLEDFAAYALDQGTSPVMLKDLYKEISTIHAQTAEGLWREQEVSSAREKTERARRTETGGIATAAAASPEQYAAIMMNPALRDRLPKELTGDYNTDSRVLRAIGKASMDTNQQEDNKRQLAELDAQQARFAAGHALREAKVAAADVDFLHKYERYEQLAKNGQAATEAGIAAKNEVAAAARARRAAAADKAAPQLPLDLKARVLNKAYTIPDGRIATWEIDPATGEPGLNVRKN